VTPIQTRLAVRHSGECRFIVSTRTSTRLWKRSGALSASRTRYPEWWPRVVEVEGERFEEDDESVQVTNTPRGNIQSHFLVEHRDDLREIRMSCDLSGAYAAWLLTPAQVGTLIELEMGMDPKPLSDRVLDLVAGWRYFQTWSQQSLEALRMATS